VVVVGGFYTKVGLVVIGLLFVVLSFRAQGIRGAMASRERTAPLQSYHRLIFGFVGLAAVAEGLHFLWS
jgi:hypothetical protein